MEIVAAGDIEKLRQLFEDPESAYHADPGPALNGRDKDGKSCLDVAAMLGRDEAVLELLERGAGVNNQTKKGDYCPVGKLPRSITLLYSYMQAHIKVIDAFARRRASHILSANSPQTSWNGCSSP